MESLTRRRWLTMAGVPVLAGLGAYGAREEMLADDSRPRFQPAGPGAARASIQERHLPNVPLVTHDNERVYFYDDLVKDKKVVLTFISGRAVPESQKVTENLATLQRFFGSRVGSEIFFYSITRTPEHDTRAALKRWAEQSGAGPGWRFLTGKPAAVDKLRKGLGFSSDDAAEDASPAYSIGLLRHGVEREMRWAHCQSQASPRVLAHSMLLDFGAGLTGSASNGFFTANPRTGADPSTFIWSCGTLLQGLD